jgi:hypothetical protein
MQLGQGVFGGIYNIEKDQRRILLLKIENKGCN